MGAILDNASETNCIQTAVICSGIILGAVMEGENGFYPAPSGLVSVLEAKREGKTAYILRYKSIFVFR